MHSLDKKHLPRHVVIIPDGNRRWATAKHLDAWKGHHAGAKSTEKIIERGRKMGVRYMSFWGSSLDNLTKRPMEEKKKLLEVYLKNFQTLRESKEIHEDNVRVRILGRWREQFPAPLTALLEKCIDETKQYDTYHLTFFLAYSGDDEMLEAVRGIVRGGVNAEDVTAETLKRHLYTADLPPVDYLIRTGGEPHLSAGFMMWDMANAQLHFSDLNYPDFGADQFEEAIRDFGARGRRLGK